VQQFNFWSEELPFVEKLLREDIRNNSAWNHRFFIMKNTRWPFDDTLRKAEVKFALDAIQTVPHNEASLNYLGAFLGSGDGRIPWDSFPEVEATARAILAREDDKEEASRGDAANASKPPTQLG